MYRDRDFDLKGALPAHAAALTQDLELDFLFDAMAGADKVLLQSAKAAILTSLQEPETILYRQHILTDCLERPAIIRQLYAIAVEAIEGERKIWSWASMRQRPDATLHRAVEALQLLVCPLKKLRLIANEQGAAFRSEGLTVLLGMLAQELGDEYLSTVEDHLGRLAFRDGILMSAELGKGNKGSAYILRKPSNAKQSFAQRLQAWIERVARAKRSRYIYQVADRDESGFRSLEELKSRGISLVAGALAQSTDHIVSFFEMLRSELGFYIGCLNLRDRLAQKGEPICFPEPISMGKAALYSRGLYDVCLALSIEARVAGNTVNADDRSLVMITGINRGGKSTFLRSVGHAQLMMQCGMFVPAEVLRANVCSGLLTHYKREEDATMRSGKLDEELRRMSSLIDHVTPNSIILLNESFASTNEREGSEIARQIVRALLEAGVKVFYVTHMFDLAHEFYRANMDTALFLRAERLADGQRTYRLEPGAPLPTSHGEDLYRHIFGVMHDDETVAPRA
jgi:DNA mismatch repair ATPase MutS